jgi:hypothetical protein
MNCAPIVLFVYNRPWHTRHTIEALQQNELAEDSELFIYSDAAKTHKDAASVKEVRDYIHVVTGFKRIQIIERDKNWGLADSIIDGVTRIVNEYGKIIVLEDDLVTSPYFLKFMNDALNVYENEERVMHVSGWNYPLQQEGYDETLFIRGTSCWGWATWADSWARFEKNTQKLFGTFSANDRYRLDYDGVADMWRQVELNHVKKINTWAIFWYTSVFKRNGLGLHPAKTLVCNIGHDGSGEHCGVSKMYEYDLSNEQVQIFSDEIVENKNAMLEIKGFLNKNKRSFPAKCFAIVKRVIGKFSAERL